jgi:CheY-like chemotaxis protein
MSITVTHRIVLIAEDNPDEQDMYAEWLRLAGFEVIAVGDGAAAVAEARRKKPDIVVMDMAMPTLSGMDATRELKADAALAAVPVIALTAYPYASHRAIATDVGADAFVQKPCSPDDLLTLILRMLA